jgi:hypothetical protein
MSKTTLTAIRLSRTPEVSRALTLAKKRYPTLSDPEILKVGLAMLTADSSNDKDLTEIRNLAAHSLNSDGYLSDPREDIYHSGMGKKVSF